MNKNITPVNIRTGKVKYTINDFARDFKPLLESDLRSVKGIDHNPEVVKRAMYDIFLFLANAPFIKQDMVAASKHYGIPADQIQVYLDRYHEENEILLTLIDVEYERLFDKYGKSGEQKVINHLDKMIRDAAKIIYT